VLDGWRLLRRELEFHHAAEDADLWPVLRPRLTTAEEKAAVDAMVEEHARIPEALSAVDASMGSGSGRSEAVKGLRTLVVEHLDHEEQAVLPLVATHLTDREWHDFMLAERSKRRPPERPQFLTWVLDDASPENAEAVLREIPAPGRFVYRSILKPRYDRQRLWSTDEPTTSSDRFHPTRASA
jgi:hypothetical protein